MKRHPDNVHPVDENIAMDYRGEKRVCEYCGKVLHYGDVVQLVPMFDMSAGFYAELWCGKCVGEVKPASTIAETKKKMGTPPVMKTDPKEEREVRRRLSRFNRGQL